MALNLQQLSMNGGRNCPCSQPRPSKPTSQVHAPLQACSSRRLRQPRLATQTGLLALSCQCFTAGDSDCAQRLQRGWCGVRRALELGCQRHKACRRQKTSSRLLSAVHGNRRGGRRGRGGQVGEA